MRRVRTEQHREFVAADVVCPGVQRPDARAQDLEGRRRSPVWIGEQNS
jgi:hypothetical protein